MHETAIKKISLSITEFAVPSPLKGSIEASSGFARGKEEGQEIHARIQKARSASHENYTSEVLITSQFERSGFLFEVSGRMDGIFSGDPSSGDPSSTDTKNQSQPKIEEIKTSFNIFELWKKLKDASFDHPYCLQLCTYGYFYWLKHKKIPELNLHLVSSRNGESRDLLLQFSIKKYEVWLELRLQELVVEATSAEKRAKRRKKAGSELKFPFEMPRPSQRELIQTIEGHLTEKAPLLIQAPTGLGKTVGVLYPIMKEALTRGQKTVYVTPKNSQHRVAEEAAERMQSQGAGIKAMTLTAKSKMCFKNEPICNPEFCEYARDHYTKIAEHEIPAKLSKKRNLTARTFKKLAKEFEVCPFEIQIDALKEADLLICDYNYVFAPGSVLSQTKEIRLHQQGKPNLVIDEAHNLPSRAMDYYSPSLTVPTLERMRDDIRKLPWKFQMEAEKLLDECISVVKACDPKDQQLLIQPPVANFHLQDENLRGFLSGYLNSDIEIRPRDVILRLVFYWAEFTSALAYLALLEFFATFSQKPLGIRITCCDASEMLKDSYADFEQVIGFSATLKPFDYYSRLAGLNFPNLKTAEFVSPFPQKNRKVLIIPQISSKYSQREQHSPKIAEAITRISSLRRGNYFAFFPSFDFMEKVLQFFSPPEGMTVIRQERFMKKDDIDDVIERLKEKSQGHLIFAVSGGVFSEGVDYPGEMVIGAFIVGPPLPSFDFEREEMRKFYQEKYQAGFDYAYTYPAMAKAIQAAGRVIRSETDKGIIILMDDRFINLNFSKSMPQDWFERGAGELVSGQILKDVSEFWNSATQNPSTSQDAEAAAGPAQSTSSFLGD